MDNKTRESRIDFILNQGLVTPIPARKQARAMLRNLGFRLIFWDTAYSLCFAMITILVVLAVALVIPLNYRYSGMVGAAPIFYLLISVFAAMGAVLMLSQIIKMLTEVRSYAFN